MSFYLAVWNSGTEISSDEAAARYLALRDEQSVTSEFDDQVYAFYSRLTSKYPEIEMVPEEELDACPWACGLDVAGDHVVMAIQLEQAPKVTGHIVALAAQLELVCFDPQAGKVYLPPRLEKKLAASSTGSACASEPQPAAMQVNDDPTTGGGDDVSSSGKMNRDVHDVAAKTLTIQVGASLREVEKKVIEATLCHYDGHRTLAAKILGIDRSTLREKIKKHKLKQ